MKKFVAVFFLFSLLTMTGCNSTNPTTSAALDACSLLTADEGKLITGSAFTTMANQTIPTGEPVNGVSISDCTYSASEGTGSIQVIVREGNDAQSMKSDFEMTRKQFENPEIAGEGRTLKSVAGLGTDAFWVPAKGLVPGNLNLYHDKVELFITISGFQGDDDALLEKAKSFAAKVLEKM